MNDTTAVTGTLPRRNVYSAVIKNQTSDTIDCHVEYRTLCGGDNEVVNFKVKGNGEEHKCEEQVHVSGTNTGTSSSNVYPKVIYSLQIKKPNGSTVKLVAPFDNVPHDDQRNWLFIIDNDQIHSGSKN